MINIQRRGFLFGAVATLVLPPVRTFYVAPKDIVSPIALYRRVDLGPDVWQAYREVTRHGVLHDVTIKYAAPEDSYDTPEIKQWLEDKLVLRL